MAAEPLAITLDPVRSASARSSQPYHRQIYRQVREAILMGRLRPGDRLPSTRDLASQLDLARNTVARAYADLLAEGYLTGQVGSGTYVASSLGAEPRLARHSPGGSTSSSGSPTLDLPLTEWGAEVQGHVAAFGSESVPAYDFRPGTPDWRAFPKVLWSQLLRQAMRRRASELARYGSPAGYLPLRQAIARHLSVSRGVAASAEQIVIVSGSQQGLDLLTRLWIRPNDVVAVEDPGYPDARQAFAVAKARICPVPVDDDGLDVDSLDESTLGCRPRLVYVTPSHQFPTGVTMALARRLALLDWAVREDALIVEDDYDSEVRYVDRPIESLQGLDRSGRVVYLGTFSTVLFPPLRVGYVVLPSNLVEPFVRAKWLADRQTSTLEQLALTEFLEAGHFNRHLWRMRRLAARRRQALLEATGAYLAGRVEQVKAGAGMHAMVRFTRLRGRDAGCATPSALEERLVARAADRSVGVYAVGPCCIRPLEQPALLLGYAALEEDQIREGIRRLAEVVDSLS